MIPEIFEDVKFFKRNNRLNMNRLNFKKEKKMSIHNPETEEELIEYCKRSLGEDRYDDGTLELDITDNQTHDIVSESIQFFKEFAYDGSYDVMYVIPTITGKTQYMLPSNTFAVHSYYPFSDLNNYFSLDWQLKTTIGNNLRFFQGDVLTTIEITKEYLALLDLKLGKKFDYTYNYTTKVLNIVAGAETGQKICVVASAFIDNVPPLFENRWLRRYVSARFLEQIARNFMQYDGVKLPGGVTIPYEKMLADATTRIKDLENELYTQWARPVRFKRG